MKKALDALTTMTTTIATATKDLTESIATIRAEIVAKQQALDRAINLPRPKAEQVARAETLVAIEAAAYLDSAEACIHGDRGLGYPGEGEPRLSWSRFDPVPWGAMCLAEPARAVALLTGIIMRVDVETGLPTNERPAIVARLRQELTDLQRSEETAVDAANAAGLGLAHRPDVVERRAKEARAEQLRLQQAATPPLQP